MLEYSNNLLDECPTN